MKQQSGICINILDMHLMRQSFLVHKKIKREEKLCEIHKKLWGIKGAMCKIYKYLLNICKFPVIIFNRFIF